jgi:hypothetical protein
MAIRLFNRWNMGRGIDRVMTRTAATAPRHLAAS